MASISHNGFPAHRPTRTKIVATIGPACDTEEMLEKLAAVGVDVFRINMAHSKPETAPPTLDRIRAVSKKIGQPIAVLADLAGPKMRLGELPNGEYRCETGSTVSFIRGKISDTPGVFTTTYEPLLDDLTVGDRVLLADGTVTLEVIRNDSRKADCRVVQGGVVRSRQGVNLPGVKLSVKTIQPADAENARWAVREQIDFLGLSFVRSPEDIEELRAILLDEAQKKAGDAWAEFDEVQKINAVPQIIAKIEKPETFDCLEKIVAASDGVMVARGDLGVEMNIARIAVIQKEIIRTCRRLMKPVIVATQMLESMTNELLPTRAEATDVANAILDGADACMLSGESAVGKYPVQAVEMMQSIAAETEELLRERSEEGHNDYEIIDRVLDDDQIEEPVKISIAVCDCAGQLADTIGAAMIFVSTQTGRTALNLSKMRNFVMTVGTSPSEAVLRRLCLYWGVIPIPNVPASPQEMLENLTRRALEAGYLEPGESVVLTAGIGTEKNNQNAIYVHIIPEEPLD